MPTDSDRLKRYLVCETPDKQWVTDKLIYLLSGEVVIPPFSAAAIKLGQLSRDENCQMEDVAEVILMDAGLASDIIKVASSVGFAARRVASIDQALMMIGMTEVRRIALSMGVMKNFEHLKSQVDWNSFWLHSILVARLTERVAAAYRPPCGSEYLAGLLHDCGKLVLEHYFPEDFDRVIIRATERGCGHVSVEKEFIGVSHAQIGAAVCECLQAHLEVIRGVWYHHDTFTNEEASQPDNSKFLAACVGVADALTNYKQINIFGARIMDYDKPFEELPEWKFLAQYDMSYGLDLDLDLEVEKAREDLKSFGLGGGDNNDNGE